MAIYCENCGAALESGKKFCSQCGAMNGQSGAPAGQPTGQTQPTQPTPPPPAAAGFGGNMAPPPKSGGQTIALYDQDYDQSPPSRPSQPHPPSQQPFAPKSQQEVFAPKPVYPPQAGSSYPPQAASSYPPRPAYAVPPIAPVKTASSDSLILTLGLLLLTNIPILGLIPAILIGFKPDVGYRGVLMKAMIAINLIWSITLGILFYQFYAILSQVAEINFYWF